MSELQVRSPDRHVREATNICFFLSLSLSFPLSLKSINIFSGEDWKKFFNKKIGRHFSTYSCTILYLKILKKMKLTYWEFSDSWKKRIYPKESEEICNIKHKYNEICISLRFIVHNNLPYFVLNRVILNCYSAILVKKMELNIFFLSFFYCCSSTQLSLFPPSTTTTPSHPSHPHLGNENLQEKQDELFKMCHITWSLAQYKDEVTPNHHLNESHPEFFQKNRRWKTE